MTRPCVNVVLDGIIWTNVLSVYELVVAPELVVYECILSVYELVAAPLHHSHPHPHPHPHFVLEYEMVATPELESGFFSQPLLDYYFQEYWSDHSYQNWILVQI
jgi:hypothetical protein